MRSKSLLIGIISFIAGALLVATAAAAFYKPKVRSDSMTAMAEVLKDKSGDEFDKEFISQMIAHHEGAIVMAERAEKQAKHDEIKVLAKAIINAQEKEIADMKKWQTSWGYGSSAPTHQAH